MHLRFLLTLFLGLAIAAPAEAAVTQRADGLVLCSAGDTFTLPTATNRPGRVYRVKNTGATTCTVATTSSQTIDGSATLSVYPGEQATLTSDVGNWISGNARGLNVSRWQSRPTLKLMAIGDSYTDGALDQSNATLAPVSVTGLFSPLDEIWAGSAAMSPARDDSGINVTTGSDDAGILTKSSNSGTFVSRIPKLLRQSYPWLGTIRIVNLGVGGAAWSSWAGANAGGYFLGNGNASDGDTATAAGVVYTFRGSPSAAYDVQIGGSINATLVNLAHAINGVGTGFAAGTLANPNVYATIPGGTTCSVGARVQGSAGNTFTISVTGSLARICISSSRLGPVNLAGGSDTSALYANGQARMVNFGTPDVVLALLGTNDAYRRYFYWGGGGMDVQANIAKTVAKIHTDYPLAKIVLWYPPPISVTAWDSQITDVVNPATAAVAAANPSFVSYIDAHSIPVGSGAVTTRQADGVHHTLYGAELHAQLVAKAIATAMGYSQRRRRHRFEGNRSWRHRMRCRPGAPSATSNHASHAGRINLQ